MFDYCFICGEPGDTPEGPGGRYLPHDGDDDVSRATGPLVWDEGEEGYRHADCSWERADRVLPEVVRRLKAELSAAEALIMNPEPTDPPHAGYLRALSRLRHITDLAAHRLFRLVPKPGARPLEGVLEEIVAEGHVDVDIQRYHHDGRVYWRCRSDRDVIPYDRKDVSYEERIAANHAADARGDTAVEAAENRLRDIRAGQGLAVFVSWFAEPVDVEISEPATTEGGTV
jgi:hypothetical protein